jgi:hypothetical protein
MLYDGYPDESLTDDEKTQADEWLRFSIDNIKRMLVAHDHLGWCVMQGAKL